MLPNHLSSHAEALLQQLRSSPCVGVFDRDAAEELISAGLAKHIPATGTVEATLAGRAGDNRAQTASADPPAPAKHPDILPTVERINRPEASQSSLERQLVPTSAKSRTSPNQGEAPLPTADMRAKSGEIYGQGQSGLGRDCADVSASSAEPEPSSKAPSLGSGLGVNGTASSEDAPVSLKSNYDPANGPSEGSDR